MIYTNTKYFSSGHDSVVLYDQMQHELARLQEQVQKTQDYLNQLDSKYMANDYWKYEFDHLARSIAQIRIQAELTGESKDRVQVHNATIRPFHFVLEDYQLTLAWEDIDGDKFFQPCQLVHYHRYQEYFRKLGSYQQSVRDYIHQAFDRGLHIAIMDQAEIKGLKFGKPTILYEFTFPDHLRRDYDNYCVKQINDRLVLNGFIQDDSMDQLDIQFCYRVEKGKSSIKAILYNQD